MIIDVVSPIKIVTSDISQVSNDSFTSDGEIGIANKEYSLIIQQDPDGESPHKNGLIPNGYEFVKSISMNDDNTGISILKDKFEDGSISSSNNEILFPGGSTEFTSYSNTTFDGITKLNQIIESDSSFFSNFIYGSRSSSSTNNVIYAIDEDYVYNSSVPTLIYRKFIYDKETGSYQSNSHKTLAEIFSLPTIYYQTFNQATHQSSVITPGRIGDITLNMSGSWTCYLESVENLMSFSSTLGSILLDYHFFLHIIHQGGVDITGVSKWLNDDEPVFEDGFSYEISITNGLGIYMKYPYQELV